MIERSVLAFLLGACVVGCSGDDASGTSDAIPGTQSPSPSGGKDAGTTTSPGGPDSGTTTTPPPATDGGSTTTTDSGTKPPPPGTCGGGGGPNGGPGDLFPCDSTWLKDVSALPVATESSSIIAGIGAWGAGGQLLIDISILFMHDNGTAPKKTFTIDYADESDPGPVPIPAGGAVEGETSYNCASGGDCHLIVVDDSTHKLFELYSASNGGGSTWTAAQQSIWDLTKHYGPQGRGLGCTSADAAGLSVMAGLIGVRETKAGNIAHALRFILPNSKIRKGPSFVTPATHGTSATSSASGPPYGTRLRLKASFDENSVTTTGGRAIVRAMKKYGMILADGGEYALTAEDDRLEKAKDPTMSWSGVLGGSDVHFIKPTDFEVVDYGTVQKSTNCTLL